MGKKYQKEAISKINTLFFSIVLLGVVLVVAGWFYQDALTQASYTGLPTVPCLDYTKPVMQSYTLWIKITVSGKSYPLDPKIGYDNGNCLHDIYVHDASGKVFVKANDAEKFTLGQFFDVWKITFDEHQMGKYILPPSEKIKIFVNGKSVTTGRNTVLHPNDHIEIIY